MYLNLAGLNAKMLNKKETKLYQLFTEFKERALASEERKAFNMQINKVRIIFARAEHPLDSPARSRGIGVQTDGAHFQRWIVFTGC